MSYTELKTRNSRSVTNYVTKDAVEIEINFLKNKFPQFLLATN